MMKTQERFSVTLEIETYKRAFEKKGTKSWNKYINDLVYTDLNYTEDKQLKYKLNYMDKELQILLVMAYTMMKESNIENVEDYHNKKQYKDAKAIVDEKIQRQKDKLR